MDKLFMVAVLFCLSIQSCTAQQQNPPRWNVLLIMIDDLNDQVGASGHPQAITPNLDAFGTTATVFRSGHCASPVCNPSRTALLTGYRPDQTGILANGDGHFRDKAKNKDIVTLPQYFLQQGYEAVSSGKIYHKPSAPYWDKEYSWSDVRNKSGNWGGGPETKVAGLSWKPTNAATEETPDYLTTEAIGDYLDQPHSKPFFAACGIFRPHLAWNVPKQYFDMYNIDSLQIPEDYLQNDLADLPDSGQKASNNKLKEVQDAGLWKEAIRAYLASSTYADVCVGNILQRLENSGHADSTIVVIAGDHGWHLGQKEHFQKFTLWERAIRTTFMIRVPGMTNGAFCDKAVSLQDIYPTLIDLCQLPPKEDVRGISLRTLLQNPAPLAYKGYALTSFRSGHSLRTDDYRYIIYNDGNQELYDHTRDPYEWKNLANTMPEVTDSLQAIVDQVLAGNDNPLNNQLVTHTSQPKVLPQLNVFPNPAWSHLQLQHLTAPLRYRILDQSGRIVQDGKTGGLVNISTLPTGMFHFQISGFAPWRFVKTR